MPGLGVVEASAVTLAGDPLRHLLARDELQRAMPPFISGLLLPLMQQRHAPWQHCRPQMAAAVIAVEAVALGQFTQLTGCPAHAIPQTAGALDAQRLFQRRHIAGPAQNRLPTVAPRGCPGHTTGLQQNDLAPCFGQAQSSVQTTETSTDHQHLALQIILQHGMMRQSILAAMGVIAVDVLTGMAKHRRLMKFKIINFMKIYRDNFTKASLSGSGDLLLQLHTAFEMSEQPFIYRLGQNPTQAFAAEKSVACRCRTPLPFDLPDQRIIAQ